MITRTFIRCAYCGLWREKNRGWHDCAQAKMGKRRLTSALVGIDETMRGGKERIDNGRPSWAPRRRTVTNAR